MRTDEQRRSQRRTPSALPLDSTSSRPKASSTERQWRLALSADDLRSLLSTGIALDRHYVEDNARQWDVFRRWSDFFDER